MSKIEVNVVDQVMSFTNMPVIASGDINVDRIKFTFDSNWDGFESKICVFYQQKGEYYYGLLGADNEVVIPSGAMKNEGNVYFGISASDGENVRTSNILIYEIVEGAYTEIDPSEGQDLIIQIQEKINEMFEKYNSVVDSLAHVRIEGDNEFEYSPQQIQRLTDLELTRPKFKYGSYVGNGLYGAEHPTVIDADFEILFVYIARGQFTGIREHITLLKPCQPDIGTNVDADWNTENTIKLTSTSGSSEQFNSNGVTYNYLILGR